MMLQFTIECAICDDALDTNEQAEFDVEEGIRQVSDWMRNHSCISQPGRGDI